MLAKSFIKTFPHGSIVTTHELDGWLAGHQLLPPCEIPGPDATDKEKRAWNGHVMNRNNRRKALNAEALQLENGKAFQLEVNTHGKDYIVRDLIGAHKAGRESLPVKVEKVYGTRRRQLEAVQESPEFIRLREEHPSFRLEVARMERDLQQAERRLELEMQMLSEQMDEVRMQFHDLLEGPAQSEKALAFLANVEPGKPIERKHCDACGHSLPCDSIVCECPNCGNNV